MTICPNLQAAPDAKFSAPAVYNATGAEEVTVKDLNGDDKPDFAVVTRLPNSLIVYTNSGNGAFVMSSTNAMTNQTFTVASEDLTGDGRPDIIAGMSRSITIFTNIGNGIFDNSITYNLFTNAAHNISSTALGDFNGDHKFDIAAGIIGANRVVVLLNNGDGTFGSPTNFSTGSTASLAPGMIVLADVNKDGILDIVTSNGSDAGTVSVMLGNGDGSFATGVLYSPKGHPASIVVADFNNDGKPDIFTANFLENSTSFLAGNGDGTFKPASTNVITLHPDSSAAGDFNGDGNLDVIIVHMLLHPSTAKGILLGKGDGTFEAETHSIAPNPAANIVVADLNGDQQPDLAIPGLSTVAVMLNQSLPALRALGHNNEVVLQWPDWAGYVLESIGNLPSSTWAPITNSPTLINHQYFLTNSASDTQQFFRLSHP